MTAKVKNDLISKLYINQHKWLTACAFNLTKNQDKADELVQQLYLQLLEMETLEKLIYQGDSLNQFYLYKIIKSLFIKSIQKIPHTAEITLEVEETIEGDDYMSEGEGREHQVLGYINEALEQLPWFDKHLWDVYCKEKHSIVSLHDATKISTSTIWSSQQKLKKYVKHYVQLKLNEHE